MKHTVPALLLLAAGLFTNNSTFAQSTCTAKNTDDPTVVCEASCSEGETASCHDSSGGNSPTCECNSNEFRRDRPHFFGQKNRAPIALQPIETTNIRSVINEKIKSPQHHVSDLCHQESAGRECFMPPHDCNFIPGHGLSDKDFNCHPECKERYKNVCAPVNASLTVTGALVLETPPVVIVEKPNWNDIPSRALGLRVRYKNCTPVEQNASYMQTETVRVGARVVKTKSIDAGLDITATLEFDFFEKAGLSVKYSSKTSITNSAEENSQKEQTETYTMPIKVPPMSEITVEHSYIEREIPVKYSGVVQIDAPVSSNQEGITLVSQIIPDKKDRQFTFSGYVVDSQFAESDVDVRSKKLTDSECESQPGQNLAFPESFVKETPGEKFRSTRQTKPRAKK